MYEWGKMEDIVERMTLRKRGELVKVFRLSAVTNGGVPFTMDVEEGDLSRDRIDEILGERARTLDGILTE